MSIRRAFTIVGLALAVAGPAGAGDLGSDLDAWCDEGDPSCRPPKPEESKASKLQASCDAGTTTDCVRLGRLLMEKGPDQDPPRAVALYRKACEEGNPVGCSSLGLHYWAGAGVPKDQVRGVELFQRACDGGYAHGCSQLGDSYLEGAGIEQNTTLALGFATQACNGGCVDGCATAGYILGSPKLGFRDPERSLEFLDKACEGGVLVSCALKGLALYYGQGTATDEPKGLALAKKACDGGDPYGCRVYGALLARSPDPAQREVGFQVLDKTCKAGNEAACQQRDELRRAQPAGELK